MADVYKRWADYLYDKGEYLQAAEKFVKTIGRLEASYVIHKLLDAQRIEALTLYLEARVRTLIFTQIKNGRIVPKIKFSQKGPKLKCCSNTA